MKKIGMFLIVMMIAFASFAENGITFASDSTYVATANAISFGLVANPNGSTTVKFAPFTFVSTANASFDVMKSILSLATFSQKLDVVVGPIDIYVTPTVDLLKNFTLTLPSAFVLSKVVPFTTVTVSSDVIGFVKNTWSVTATAEMVF